MSLEIELAANTAAINALTAVWSKLAAQSNAIGTRITIVEPPQAKKPADTPTAPETKAAKPEPAAASPSEPAITYDQVAASITAKVKVDRNAVVTALAHCGVKKGPELKPDQYAEFLKVLG